MNTANMIRHLREAPDGRGGYPYQLVINDPGAGGAIKTDGSGVVAIDTPAGLTAPQAARTLAAPKFLRQEVILNLRTLGTVGANGEAQIVVSNAFDGTHTTVTLTAAGQSVKLYSVYNSKTTYVWALDANNGATLS